MEQKNLSSLAIERRFYINYPIIQGRYDHGIPLVIDPEFIAIWLGIPLLKGKVRLDVIKLLRDYPAAILNCRDDLDVRHAYTQMYGDDMAELYARTPPGKGMDDLPDGWPIRLAAAYVCKSGINAHFEFDDEKGFFKLLGQAHKNYGIPMYSSGYMAKSRNPAYRREIAHMLAYPGIPSTIKSVLLNRTGDPQDILDLAEVSGLYDNFYTYLRGIL